MNASRTLVLGASVLLAGLVAAPGAIGAEMASFGKAKIRFEQNVTDEDVEVVMEITAGEEGLSRLLVMSPDGKTAVDFSAPDPATSGIRSFVFESPEPKDVEALMMAYPVGEYRFKGTSSSGKELSGTATLSHDLPDPSAVVAPASEAEGVMHKGLEVRWQSVADVAAFIVEVEQEESGMKIVTRYPGSVTSMKVPDNFLQPGLPYKISIGTVSKHGNISFVETEFETGQ